MTIEKHEKAFPIRIPNVSFVVALLGLLAAGIFVYIYITPDGVGLTNDSADYLGGARSLLAGDGYVRYSGDRQPRPITQFPPFYSAAIAKAVWFGAKDVFHGAEWINGLSIVLNLFLVVALVLATTRREWIAIFAGVLTLFTPSFLQAHVYGLSEALASVWILTALLILSVALRKTRRPVWIWLLLGALFGVAALVRYASLVFFAGSLFLVFANGRNWKNRIVPAFGLFIGFIFIFLPWIIRNRLVGDSGVNRAFSFHFPTSDRLWDGVRTVSSHFLPEAGGIVERALPLWALAIILTLIILTGLTIWRLASVFRGLSHDPDGEAMAISPSGFFTYFMLLYVVELLLTAIFVDGSTVFDDRMLYPFFIMANPALCAAAQNRFEKHGRRIAVLAALGLILIFVLEDGLDRIREYRRDGQGFAGSEWRDSETANAIPELSETVRCFSNRRTYLGLMKDLPCYVLPVGFDAATQRVSESFAADREWMRSEIEAGKAIAIVFGYTDELDSESEDAKYFDELFGDLTLYGSYEDGRIYGNPQ